jgi:hypothetical protein
MQKGKEMQKQMQKNSESADTSLLAELIARELVRTPNPAKRSSPDTAPSERAPKDKL